MFYLISLRYFYITLYISNRVRYNMDIGSIATDKKNEISRSFFNYIRAVLERVDYETRNQQA